MEQMKSKRGGVNENVLRTDKINDYTQDLKPIDRDFDFKIFRLFHNHFHYTYASDLHVFLEFKFNRNLFGSLNQFVTTEDLSLQLT